MVLNLNNQEVPRSYSHITYVDLFWELWGIVEVRATQEVTLKQSVCYQLSWSLVETDNNMNTYN
jgi:hypothetical protein